MPVRVYMEDTDVGGIVYYVNYLKFMERARSEWLRRHCINQQALLVENTQLVVYRLTCHYAKPALLDDALTVTALVTDVGRCKATFEQVVEREEELLCRATVEIACLNARTMKPKRWPAQVLKVFNISE
ncbi:tol-pal system-associated acyl-CoA thioesterase [Halomonas sp. TBZ9]|uniref:Tol-pal system-associated acyl-CoA thioesterase n=2 Tax=Vreelandella azerica TaxID=2732867 RepID=A0A7Y3U209_9GAMM|nr:tol-pal system-associated acyl-CoA thioesterase [Halomonas azerica]